ncbi:MAG: NADP-dependent isocitrate dehydrogenase [Bacillota bacterium]|nr:isocitrate dehydrogenase [Bacillota bacterium]
MADKIPITVARGDGIGPEIMDAVLHILMSAGAAIEPEFIEIGEKVYLAGHTSGITDEAWESLRRTKVFLKAPITTPQGGGYKSLNVTTRKMLGLYANVRPAVSYHPFVPTKYPGMDVVIIRENEEDLYAGIEHQQTPDVVQSLKIISRPGSERIIRFAFEYARQYGRKKVTCFTKDNIMKMSDGLFHEIFREVAKEYPDIEAEHWIVDIGMAKMADTPEQFDVIVLPNLYGDIASDIVAQIAGSVGLAGSANIGDECAMFEAIHGSAPRRAGQNVANPSGLLHGAIMMLVHIGLNETATLIHNAWLKTIEDGVHTYDIARGGPSVGTKEFAQAVVERLGEKPRQLKAVDYGPSRTDGKPLARQPMPLTLSRSYRPKRELNGVDVYLYNTELSPSELGRRLEELAGPEFSLTVISNRGVKVYPDGFPETFLSDHWRCRFEAVQPGKATRADIVALLGRLDEAGFEWIKLDNLYLFDGQRAYSLDQGQ